VVHGSTDYKQALNDKVITQLADLTDQIETFSKRTSDETSSVHKTLSDLSISRDLIDSLLEPRAKLSTWDVLLVLLYHAPDGLTFNQVQSLSEELGHPITYDWLNTEFHRKQHSGLVIAKPIPNSKHKRYFLSELGKKRAYTSINQLTQGKT
jgi:hypothetical protein